MEFFDRKEEVMDIQLTQYGKHLLSLGRFRPSHYAFFDDDIVYDLKFVTGSENQNNSEDRIKETPRLKTQYVFSGIETEITKNTQLVRPGWMTDWEPVYDEYGEYEIGVVAVGKYWGTESPIHISQNFIQPHADKTYTSMLPLGHSSISSQYAPAWDVKFLHNSASAIVPYLTNQDFPHAQIPQSEVEILYKTYATHLDMYGNLMIDYVGQEEEISGFTDVFFKQYKNETTLQMKEDYLLLSVVEDNAEFKRENFDIEVFELDLNTSGEVINEKQLFFLDDKLALESNTYAQAASDDFFQPENYVEYWFDIFADDEIDPEIFCRAKYAEKSKNIFADQFNVFDCPGLEEKPTYPNIYEVLLTDEDFEDPC